MPCRAPAHFCSLLSPADGELVVYSFDSWENSGSPLCPLLPGSEESPPQDGSTQCQFSPYTVGWPRSASRILVCLTTLPASPSKALPEQSPAWTPNREVEHGIALTLLPASWLMPVAQPHTPHHHFCFPRPTPGRKPRSHLQAHPSSLSPSHNRLGPKKTVFPYFLFLSTPRLHETMIRLTKPA